MSSIGTVDDSETKLFIPLSREPSGPPTPLAGNNVTNQTTEEQPSVVESFDDFDLMAPRKLFDSAKKVDYACDHVPKGRELEFCPL